MKTYNFQDQIPDKELSDLMTDKDEGLYLAWLLPTATVALSVVVISMCQYFGWLV